MERRASVAAPALKGIGSALRAQHEHEELVNARAVPEAHGLYLLRCDVWAPVFVLSRKGGLDAVDEGARGGGAIVTLCYAHVASPQHPPMELHRRDFSRRLRVNDETWHRGSAFPRVMCAKLHGAPMSLALPSRCWDRATTRVCDAGIAWSLGSGATLISLQLRRKP